MFPSRRASLTVSTLGSSHGIIGTYRDRPLPYLLGIAPTIGQSLYVAILVALNIIVLAAGYKTLGPRMQWYEDRHNELLAYFMWRTGVLAFAHMPALFLFSTRNNPLLWLTKWLYSTFLLLHRWVARLFLLQTLLYSIVPLVLYQRTGRYSMELGMDYWIWRSVATVAAVIIVLTSLLIFRQRANELFLVTHIVMAVIYVVGRWYHVWYAYENTFGYETWRYTTVAVRFTDRIVRVARILKTSVRRATVTDIGSTIARVDVPSVGWTAQAVGRSVYVYFPTLSPPRPWENHPFSIIPTAMLARPTYADRDASSRADLDLVRKQDEKKR